MFEESNGQVRLIRSNSLANQSSALQLKRSLKDYVLPKYPTLTGLSKFTFICLLKLRLCSLSLVDDPAKESVAILIALLIF